MDYSICAESVSYVNLSSDLRGGEEVLSLGVFGGAGRGGGNGGVELHEASDVGLGALDDLDLADADVVEGEYAGASLSDGLADGLRDELFDKLAELALAGLLLHDLDHLLADGADLRGLGVASGLLLVGASLGEGEAEHADCVAVGGLDVNVGFDEGVPLADEAAHVVAGQRHAVEVGQAVTPVDFLDDKTHILVALILIGLQVGEVDLAHAALQIIRRELCKGYENLTLSIA